MEKSHYERMLADSRFRVSEILDFLKEELKSDSVTFDQLVESDIISKTIVGALESYGQEFATTACEIIFHLYNYHFGPGRTYEVCDTIAEMLLNTKLDVDTSLVKSPFEELQVVLPRNFLHIYNTYTGIHEASTVYINLREFSED